MNKIKVSGNIIVGCVLLLINAFVMYTLFNSTLAFDFVLMLNFIGCFLLALVSFCLISFRYLYSENEILIKLFYIQRKLVYTDIIRISNTSFGLYNVYLNNRCYIIVLFFGKKEINELITLISLKNKNCII